MVRGPAGGPPPASLPPASLPARAFLLNLSFLAAREYSEGTQWCLESELLCSLLDQKGSQASEQAGIKFLSLETPVSSGRCTLCLVFAFTDMESLHSFWGIVLFPEHSKQFPTLWPFTQLSFRTRCHPISVVSETLLIWQGPFSGLSPLQNI